MKCHLWSTSDTAIKPAEESEKSRRAVRRSLVRFEEDYRRRGVHLDGFFGVVWSPQFIMRMLTWHSQDRGFPSTLGASLCPWGHVETPSAAHARGGAFGTPEKPSFRSGPQEGNCESEFHPFPAERRVNHFFLLPLKNIPSGVCGFASIFSTYNPLIHPWNYPYFLLYFFVETHDTNFLKNNQKNWELVGILFRISFIGFIF